jgi:hypothetical protein
VAFYALGRKEIEPGIIREVAEDLSITTNPETRLRPIRQVVNNTNLNGPTPAFGVGLAEARPGIARLESKPAVVKQTIQNLPSTAFVPAGFLNTLAAALIDAMGPMAKIVLRDQIKTLGESSEKFPHTKVDMLLESVSREILDEGMKEQFRHQMLEQIRMLRAS